MLIAAGIGFFVSLLAICFLFALKVREIETGRRFAPTFRAVADREALHIKALLLAMQVDMKKMLPLLVHWGHRVAHLVALKFARIARAASLHSHAFADFVSQRRNFERSETRSEFLRRMSQRRKGEEGNAPTPEM